MSKRKHKGGKRRRYQKEPPQLPPDQQPEKVEARLAWMYPHKSKTKAKRKAA